MRTILKYFLIICCLVIPFFQIFSEKADYHFFQVLLFSVLIILSILNWQEINKLFTGSSREKIQLKRPIVFVTAYLIGLIGDYVDGTYGINHRLGLLLLLLTGILGILNFGFQRV